jgi:hypothetical protein
MLGFRLEATVIGANPPTPGVALLTTWLMGADVAPVKFESPLYAAVIECVPAGRVAKGIDAPADATGTGLPIGVAPSIHWTVPVAESARAAVKDAENVTCDPNTEGLREEVAVTDGVDLLTTWIRVAVDWAIAAATATAPIHTNGAE